MLTSLIDRNFRERLRIVGNSFSQKDLSFNYCKIDPKYHASANPEDEIVLYKGALRGYENEGFLSMALGRGLINQVAEARKIIENGSHELIHNLFDEHTSYHSRTPLLSATFNPEQAQVFAPTRKLMGNEDKTIYQVRIKANRCVIDIYDTGNCGASGEVLILGAIFPEEITAVKILNENEHSELLSSCGHYLRLDADKDSNNREVKSSDNWAYKK